MVYKIIYYRKGNGFKSWENFFETMVFVGLVPSLTSNSFRVFFLDEKRLIVHICALDSRGPATPSTRRPAPHRPCGPGVWRKDTSAGGVQRVARRRVRMELTVSDTNKKLLGTKGIATRSTDATRGSWHRYQEQRMLLTCSGRPKRELVDRT